MRTTNRISRELLLTRKQIYRAAKELQINPRRTETERFSWSPSEFEALKNWAVGRADQRVEELISKHGLRVSLLNNRRYLGNKHSISEAIRAVVDENCTDVHTVADLFAGTGAVSHAFRDKRVVTNDLMYSNYLSNVAWFSPEYYRRDLIAQYIVKFNAVATSANNYMRKNFANTYFSADDCSKIGQIRQFIEEEKAEGRILTREYAILITALLYGMDRAANTVGHYDAYRQNAEFESPLVIPLLLPEIDLHPENESYNANANEIISEVECDVLYLDPPYNSRQYCDSYHLLENVARWEKPKVAGVSKKMDRSSLKSDYCMAAAPSALRGLVEASSARYILLSYNNMSDKGNSRSNAKISDEEIYDILESYGHVTVFSVPYKVFSAGQSDIQDNVERLFLCERAEQSRPLQVVQSPMNYTGGKARLLPQLQEHFPEASTFVDLFSGGGVVAVNSSCRNIRVNDANKMVIGLMRLFAKTSIDELLSSIDGHIETYSLSNTAEHGYEYYGCESSSGLADYNKEPYQALREGFNRTVDAGSPDLILFYLLIIFGFNNQIRFNRKGHFNLPVGKRDFNAKMRRKLKTFCTAIQEKNIQFSSVDFRNFDLNALPEGSLIYCDPPYLITMAAYNENGQWTTEDERALLAFLEEADRLGHKFALSNVTRAKGKTNDILTEWISKNQYAHRELAVSYANSNYQRKAEQERTVEVLVTNY